MLRWASRFLLIASLATAVAALVSLVTALVLRQRLVPRGGAADDDVELVGILGGQELVSTAARFRSARINAMFGGGTLDLRSATLDPAGATIHIPALFGGGMVVVPPSWPVILALTGVLGGARDTRDPTIVDPARPRLRVEGFAAFGGLVVLGDATDQRLFAMGPGTSTSWADQAGDWSLPSQSNP